MLSLREPHSLLGSSYDFINFQRCRLKHRQETEWKSEVELLFGDMRTIQVPEKADILVSELLGSFGDNELSPECLDGAMRFLKGMSS